MKNHTSDSVKLSVLSYYNKFVKFIKKSYRDSIMVFTNRRKWLPARFSNGRTQLRSSLPKIPNLELIVWDLMYALNQAMNLQIRYMLIKSSRHRYDLILFLIFDESELIRLHRIVSIVYNTPIFSNMEIKNEIAEVAANSVETLKSITYSHETTSD